MVRNKTDHNTNRQGEQPDNNRNGPMNTVKWDDLESSTTKLNNHYLTEYTDKEDDNKELVCKNV